MARSPVLGDHQRRGKTFVTPFNAMAGTLRDISWVKTILPEVLWLGLAQFSLGHAASTDLATMLARKAREVREGQPDALFFAAVSSYALLSDNDWMAIRAALGAALDPLRAALQPLVVNYPGCPLDGIYEATPSGSPGEYLGEVKRAVVTLYDRAGRDSMLVQATAFGLALDSGQLTLPPDTPISSFPEIERYPETDLSRSVAAAIRAGLNGFFGMASVNEPRDWATCFWNQGVQLEPCECADE